MEDKRRLSISKPVFHSVILLVIRFLFRIWNDAKICWWGSIWWFLYTWKVKRYRANHLFAQISGRLLWSNSFLSRGLDFWVRSLNGGIVICTFYCNYSFKNLSFTIFLFCFRTVDNPCLGNSKDKVLTRQSPDLECVNPVILPRCFLGFPPFLNLRLTHQSRIQQWKNGIPCKMWLNLN